MWNSLDNVFTNKNREAHQYIRVSAQQREFWFFRKVSAVRFKIRASCIVVKVEKVA